MLVAKNSGSSHHNDRVPQQRMSGPQKFPRERRDTTEETIDITIAEIDALIRVATSHHGPLDGNGGLIQSRAVRRTDMRGEQHFVNSVDRAVGDTRSAVAHTSYTARTHATILTSPASFRSSLEAQRNDLVVRSIWNSPAYHRSPPGELHTSRLAQKGLRRIDSTMANDNVPPQYTEHIPPAATSTPAPIVSLFRRNSFDEGPETLALGSMRKSSAYDEGPHYEIDILHSSTMKVDQGSMGYRVLGAKQNYVPTQGVVSARRDSATAESHPQSGILKEVSLVRSRPRVARTFSEMGYERPAITALMDE